jgi:hypothetical protein
VFRRGLLHGDGVVPGYRAPGFGQQLEACLLAVLCSVLFLGEALLPGRALVPYPPQLYDVQHAEALARGASVTLRGNVAGGDKYNQSLCWDRVLHDRLRSGDLPLWTKDIGGGAPFVPQMAQVFEPWNLLLLVWPSAQWYGVFCLLHLVLLGLFAYRFFRRLECSHPAALLGMVVAVLGLWTQCKLHHNVILTAALSLFPMLSSVHAIARSGGGARSVGVLGLWTGLSWLSGFVVVSLQATYLVGVFALYLCLANPRGNRLRPLLRCGAGLALGAGLSLAQILPVLYASAVSSRLQLDPGALAARGLEWDYAWTLLWPDLMHWAADHFYSIQQPMRPPLVTQLVLLAQPIGRTGMNWVECSFAVGIPGLLAACTALGARARRSTAWLFAGVGLFGFGLATGSALFLWPAQLLPMLTGTDLKRNLFLCAMALAVLAALGAEGLLQPRPPRVVLPALLGFAGLSTAALAWLLLQSGESLLDAIAALAAFDAGHPDVQGRPAAEIAALMRSVALPGEADANLHALRVTFGRALVVAGAAAAALRFLAPGPRGWALILLCAAELLHAGHGTAVAVPAADVTTPPAVVAPVLACPPEAPGVRPRFQRLGDPGNPRVAALYPPNLPGFHGIEDCAAYHPLPPARMEDFWLCVEPDEPDKVSVVFRGSAVGWLRREASLQHPLLDLFGVRFVLSDREVALPGLTDRTPAGAAAPYRLYERTTCLPRATFVRDVEVIADRTRRLQRLGDRDRKVRHRMILEDPDAPQPAAPHGAAEASVEILTHRDERVAIRVVCAQDGYLRLHDPWDAGWRAHVDGNEARVYVADHYLRAVYLPAGEHDVVFTYDAARVRWPLWLSGLFLVAIGSLLLRRRREAA